MAKDFNDLIAGISPERRAWIERRVKRISEELGLDVPPDEEFMRLLGETGTEPVVSTPADAPKGKAYTPEDVEEEIKQARKSQPGP